ncbi:uncharacterized protein SCHCODRAFT_02698548 [Schizophyllum commune H4-8]|nr:uncharacterized protein SCHCODRAFT_02698548 [Schizophyllum commune H4-8]KAI5897258.1 hypothetical protein SCHCODRAFT_02698548 [Schizophyllum commune H4-8]
MCSKKLAATLERELWRTKQHPLDVDLYTVDIEIPSNQEAWELLRRESHRWRTLSCSEACTVSCLREPISCPALETTKAELILPDMPRTAGYSNPSGEILVFSHVRHALNVRRVGVSVMDHYDPMRIRFPDCWRLTHLTLTIFFGENVINLLRKVMEQVSPTLEVLRISVDEGMELTRPTSPFAYPFSKLRKLELHQEAFCFITLIEAPVLAFMRVKDANLGEIEDSDSFPTLSEALGKVAGLKTLAKLELICADVEDASALLATLRELPSIEWLRLADIPRHSGCLLSHDMLAGLTRGGTSDDSVDTPLNALCPLPNLSTLFVYFEEFDAEDEEAEVAASLRRLALSRHPSVVHQEDEGSNSLRPLDAFHATYERGEHFAADVVPSWGERFEEDKEWDED